MKLTQMPTDFFLSLAQRLDLESLASLFSTFDLSVQRRIFSPTVQRSLCITDIPPNYSGFLRYLLGSLRDVRQLKLCSALPMTTELLASLNPSELIIQEHGLADLCQELQESPADESSSEGEPLEAEKTMAIVKNGFPPFATLMPRLEILSFSHDLHWALCPRQTSSLALGRTINLPPDYYRTVQFSDTLVQFLADIVYHRDIPFLMRLPSTLRMLSLRLIADENPTTVSLAQIFQKFPSLEFLTLDSRKNVVYDLVGSNLDGEEVERLIFPKSLWWLCLSNFHLATPLRGLASSSISVLTLKLSTDREMDLEGVIELPASLLSLTVELSGLGWSMIEQSIYALPRLSSLTIHLKKDVLLANAQEISQDRDTFEASINCCLLPGTLARLELDCANSTFSEDGVLSLPTGLQMLTVPDFPLSWHDVLLKSCPSCSLVITNRHIMSWDSQEGEDSAWFLAAPQFRAFLGAHLDLDMWNHSIKTWLDDSKISLRMSLPKKPPKAFLVNPLSIRFQSWKRTDDRILPSDAFFSSLNMRICPLLTYLDLDIPDLAPPLELDYTPCLEYLNLGSTPIKHLGMSLKHLKLISSAAELTWQETNRPLNLTWMSTPNWRCNSHLLKGCRGMEYLSCRISVWDYQVLDLLTTSLSLQPRENMNLWISVHISGLMIPKDESLGPSQVTWNSIRQETLDLLHIQLAEASFIRHESVEGIDSWEGFCLSLSNSSSLIFVPRSALSVSIDHEGEFRLIMSRSKREATGSPVTSEMLWCCPFSKNIVRLELIRFKCPRNLMNYLPKTLKYLHLHTMRDTLPIIQAFPPKLETLILRASLLTESSKPFPLVSLPPSISTLALSWKTVEPSDAYLQGRFPNLKTIFTSYASLETLKLYQQVINIEPFERFVVKKSPKTGNLEELDQAFMNKMYQESFKGELLMQIHSAPFDIWPAEEAAMDEDVISALDASLSGGSVD